MPDDDGSKIHDPSYEIGYREGGASAYDDWRTVLAEEFDVEPFEGPTDFIKNLKEAYLITKFHEGSARKDN